MLQSHLLVIPRTVPSATIVVAAGLSWEFLLPFRIVQLPLLAALSVHGLDRPRHLPLRRDALHRRVPRQGLKRGGLGVRLGSMLWRKI